jgi:hypothetical protein
MGGTEAGAGMGPGGGLRGADDSGASGGAYGNSPVGYPPNLTPEPYGGARLLPLIGGSGGSNRKAAASNGAGSGGGAILIATNALFTLNGLIDVTGGTAGWFINDPLSMGAGAGGAVRIIADQTAGYGGIDVRGGISGDYGASGYGGDGRVRIETNLPLWGGSVGSMSPVYTTGFPSIPAQIWPPDSTPTVKILEGGGQTVPTDPHGRIALHAQDIPPLSTLDPVTWRIESHNVPSDWTVTLRVNPVAGKERISTCTMEAGGTTDLAYWDCTLAMPSGYFTMFARAKAPDYAP